MRRNTIFPPLVAEVFRAEVKAVELPHTKLLDAAGWEQYWSMRLPDHMEQRTTVCTTENHLNYRLNQHPGVLLFHVLYIHQVDVRIQ